MPALIYVLLPWIKSFIAAAPDVAKAVVDVKNLLAALFGGKMIDAATQDKLNAHVDQIAANFQAGTPPPEWTVEPDPS